MRAPHEHEDERLAEQDDDLTFELLAGTDDRGLLAELERQGAAVDLDLPRAHGALTPAAIERLARAGPGIALAVEREGLLRFAALGEWRAAGMWLSAEEADQFLAGHDVDPVPHPPGHVWHQVHPAIGVRRIKDGGICRPLDDRTLGFGWLALPADEQRRRERDLLRELLAYARERGAEVGPEPAATDELMSGDSDPVWLFVGEQLLVDSWTPRQTAVLIAPDDAGALQRRLTDAWWEPWQRRRDALGAELERTRDGGRVSRETRARVVLWWRRGVRGVGLRPGTDARALVGEWGPHSGRGGRAGGRPVDDRSPAQALVRAQLTALALTALRLPVGRLGTVWDMGDRKLERNARGFRFSGVRILVIGLAVAVVGGLLWLLGQALGDVLAGIGGMIATLGGVAAVVGLILLGISAVTRRMSQNRPFA